MRRLAWISVVAAAATILPLSTSTAEAGTWTSRGYEFVVIWKGDGQCSASNDRRLSTFTYSEKDQASAALFAPSRLVTERRIDPDYWQFFKAKTFRTWEIWSECRTGPRGTYFARVFYRTKPISRCWLRQWHYTDTQTWPILVADRWLSRITEGHTAGKSPCPEN